MYCGGKVADTLWDRQQCFFTDHGNMCSFEMHLWENNYLLYSVSKELLPSEGCVSNRCHKQCGVM